MDMANIAKLVLFISACASLFGLGLFLFRDQIFSQSDASTPARRFWVTIWSAYRHSSMPFAGASESTHAFSGLTLTT
jgi:hypothetical protein